ncbi:MAG: transposase [bacterium]
MTRQHSHLAHLPSYVSSPIVFFTVTTQGRSRILDNLQAHSILRTVWERAAENDGWFVGDYVLMPDHAHFFARPASDAKPMANWVKLWKSVSSRRLTRELSITSPVWQPEYFDRYLRTCESYSEKWAYVEMNPVRAKLVAQPDEWPYKGRINTIMF